MRKKSFLVLIVGIFILCTFTACKKSSDPISSIDDHSGGSVVVVGSNATIADVISANCKDHEDSTDYIWNDLQVVPILLNGTSIVESSDSVSVNGTQATITSSGNYRISGSLTDGQITVHTTDEGTVRLILNGMTLYNSTTSPLYIARAKKVIIILADNTQNSITDASSYVFSTADVTEPNASIFSMSDLTFYGSGSLTVHGNYDDGIASKDGLIIKSGTITVTSVDDGIRGKDYLIVKDGSLSVTSTGDGLKSDNMDDASKGYIYIESGVVHVTSGTDAIDAQTDAIVAGGEVNLTSGGGSSKTVSGTTTAKAMKGIVCAIVGGGTFTMSSADDAIHSNGSVIINGGRFNISSGDDGIHADSILGINGGTITITKCYEGIESKVLTINNGSIHVIASDDGINGAGGNDGSGLPGFPGGNMTAGNYHLTVNGGYIAVNALGDGLDINGSITMTGGTIIVHGPTSNMNSPIDYDASFVMTGGFIVAAGSSGMAMAPSATSTQRSLLAIFNSPKAAGSLFHIQTADGADILTFKSIRSYQSVVFCAPTLAGSTSYEIYAGGSSTAAETDGLYEGGGYSGGTKLGSFTPSAIVTRVTL
jgi:hypothetical protein